MTDLLLPNDTRIELPLLTTLVENIQAISDDEYALERRKGLGASDSSVILGLNPYKTREDLIIEKRSPTISDTERAIKTKDAVRKGFDLEPIILQKFGKLMECDTPIKPPSMYQITATPCLTINFDGIHIMYTDEQTVDYLIPVEAKFVTTYGDKYYNREHAFKREIGDCILHKNCRAYGDSIDRIKAKSEAVGIPPYYYTQVQQQMYGLGSPFGYLVALHDKGWETVVYFVPRDEECIRNIIVAGTKTWIKVQR